MLNLILGRAGTGKTDHIMNDIKRRMSTGESGMLLIVPEQYSHDAERRLCSVCGDGLSLYAETLSFTRLYTAVLSEVGGAGINALDDTGQILAMHRALESVAARLKVFGIKRMRTEVLEKLLEAVKEFKSLNITPQALERAAELAENPLSDKLRDLALIYDAYDALLQIHGSDAAERLSFLADSIEESSVGSGHIYFDGFNDFTALEISVIEELLRKNAEITFCLTCDPDDENEIFEIPRKTVVQLRRLAKNYSVDVQETYLTNSEQKLSELGFIERHIFEDVTPRFDKKSDAVTIYAAPTRYVECEYAASKVWELVRNGYRWREISVMARNWEDYDSICENVFEKYGIPFFTSGKADILSKPPLTLIDAALEIATMGFEYKSVFRYLKTGLIDISTDECAILENYVLKWQIRSSLWNREWAMPPHGYGKTSDGDEELLGKINLLRLKISEPLINLRNGIKRESGAEVKLRALYSFFEEIKLAEQLVAKAVDFEERGEMRLADEYTQLWDITIAAMDQMYTILGDDNLSAVEFRKLFTLALSQNDVGVIPISLDRTTLGGMAMSRRRDIKCLIILGATDENLPTLSKNSGALSDNERTLLRDLGTNIPAGLEERLYHEMNMLYSTLTLPSKELVVIYPKSGGGRPSFIIKRLSEMFDLSEITLSEEEYMTSAEIPYRELMHSKGLMGSSVRQSQLLSEHAAEQLYGKDFTLSATRVDRFYSCPYKHFMQNGLKLEPRVPAAFDSLAAGNFVHYVLDKVFCDIKDSVGFKNAKELDYLELTEKYIRTYIREVLLDFEGKSARFEYLFQRYRTDVVHVVRDMVNELSKSSFEPLGLELDISKLSETERGFIDRVDGYSIDGKQYLRIIDYKTRKKAYSFELTDILYGRDMQMLIYLFALERYGSKIYEGEIVPAGVLYAPARDVVLSAPRNASPEDIAKLRVGEMQRSGLVLNDPRILDAMENSDVKEYLPVKVNKDGVLTGDSLVSQKQLSILSEHVRNMLENAKTQIRNGNISCFPYFKSDVDNACCFCEFSTVCSFDEEQGDKRLFVSKKKAEEIWVTLDGKVSKDSAEVDEQSLSCSKAEESK